MAGRITGDQVSRAYEMIRVAPDGQEAWRRVPAAGTAMLARLADLTYAPESAGPAAWRDHVYADAGWVPAKDKESERKRYGFGQCEWGFSSHSRRPVECRFCGRSYPDHTGTLLD